MTGIFSSISSLVEGLVQTITGILNTALSAVQGALAAVASVFAGLAGIAKNLVELVLGNIVIIGVLVAALVGYTAMQQRRGRVQGGSVSKGRKLK